jgi:succinate dehydrogenase / fumarate reductase membrane anchor subunit
MNGPEPSSLRTPLGRVRGLGAAKAGAGHFIQQRASAIALLFLTPYIAWSLVTVTQRPSAEVLAWMALPWNALAVILFLGVSFHHARLGVQVVIEDYITQPVTKAALLLLINFAAITAIVGGAFAAARISFGAT